jgi:predicted DNA-binding protein
MMRRAQVLLREDQKAALQTLSRRTGRAQSEFIRHGVDLAIAEAEKAAPAEQAAKRDWRESWRAAAGMWAERTDLDDMQAETRANDQRRAAQLEQHWRGK